MNVPLSLGAQARRKVNTSIDRFEDLFELRLPKCLILDLASHHWSDRLRPASFREGGFAQDNVRTLIHRQQLFSLCGVVNAIQEFMGVLYLNAEPFTHLTRLERHGVRWASVGEYIWNNLESIDIPLFPRVKEETLMLEWFDVKLRGITVKVCYRCACRLYKPKRARHIKLHASKQLHDDASTLMRTISSRSNWCCRCRRVPLFWLDTLRHSHYVGRVIDLESVFGYPDYYWYTEFSPSYKFWYYDVPLGEEGCCTYENRRMRYLWCRLKKEEQGKVNVEVCYHDELKSRLVTVIGKDTP